MLRGVVATTLVALLAWRMGAIDYEPSPRDWRLIGLRIVGEIGSTFCFLTALFNMPIADATAILQSVPLAVALAAAVFLAEPIGWRRYLAIGVGFVGVIIIVRPGAEGLVFLPYLIIYLQRYLRIEAYAVVLAVLNPEFEPFSNPLVRRAMAHAVDYDSITQAISPSLTQPHYSMLLPWMDVYTDDIPQYEFDPELALSLLAEAGYPDGFTFKNFGTSAQGVTELQQFQIDFLSQVGINMEMELVDTPTFNQRRNAGEFDVASRLLPAVNPDMILFSYLHPDNMVPNGLNGARYDNPEVTELLEAARAEPDKDKAFEMYKTVQQIVATDLPYLPTYSNNVFWPGKPEVTGVNINYLAQVNFYDVDIEQ
jgi:ABC-type transport system substrate-binding protein